MNLFHNRLAIHHLKLQPFFYHVFLFSSIISLPYFTSKRSQMSLTNFCFTTLSNSELDMWFNKCPLTILLSLKKLFLWVIISFGKCIKRKWSARSNKCFRIFIFKWGYISKQNIINSKCPKIYQQFLWPTFIVWTI